MSHLIDLSQPVGEPMSWYPGDPEPRVRDWPAHPPWRVSELHLGTHTGTHLDAPWHYGFPEAISDLSLDRCVGRGVVIDVTGRAADGQIGLDDLGGGARAALREGLWAVFRTGWDRHWGTPAYLTHPALDPGLARQLVAWHVPLVAVDLLNPDSTRRGEAIVHEILLGAGVLIVENLAGLDQLTAGRIYTFAMLPLKLTGLDGSPVRAVAWE